MLSSTGEMGASSSTGEWVPPLDDLRRNGMGALSCGFEEGGLAAMLGDATRICFLDVQIF